MEHEEVVVRTFEQVARMRLEEEHRIVVRIGLLVVVQMVVRRSSNR